MYIKTQNVSLTTPENHYGNSLSTHWGVVTHIMCRRIWPLLILFRNVWHFSFKKIDLSRVSSAQCRPLCSSLNISAILVLRCMAKLCRSPVNSPHKGQWRGAFMFSLICVRINGWVNNGEAGDLRGYRAHYDVIVMLWLFSIWFNISTQNCGLRFDPPCGAMPLRRGVRTMLARVGMATYVFCLSVTHRIWHKMSAISQTTFSNTFSSLNM